MAAPPGEAFFVRSDGTLQAEERGPVLRWPIEDTAAGVSAIFWGRLDDRAALAGRYRCRSTASSDEIFLAALVSDGPAAPGRLLGDFAFAAWLHGRRELLLARDHLGIRSLFYRAAADGWYVAPHLASLVSRDLPGASPDPDWLTRYLTGRLRNDRTTGYRGVARVPPGSVCRLTAGVERVIRYWQPETVAEASHPTDADYAEECRDLIIRATADRLAGVDRAAVTLSGGLDSSAVARATQLAAGGRPVRAFSIDLPSRADCDDRPYAEAAAASWGLDLIWCPLPQTLAPLLETWAAQRRSPPASPSDAIADPMWRSVRESGTTVALTGAGGDTLFAGNPFAYADLLRDRKFRDAWRRYRSPVATQRDSVLTLARTAMWPLLPAVVRGRLRNIARRTLGTLDPALRPDWLRVPEPGPEPNEVIRGGFEASSLLRSLTSGEQAYLLEWAGMAAAAAGVELRHPLLDVRLVEFALRLPAGQRRQAGLNRIVLRNAFTADFPPAIARRTTKADFSFGWCDAVDDLGGLEFFRSLRLARDGIVDAERLQDIYRRMAAARSGTADAFADLALPLWNVASAELWWRTHGAL